QLLEEVSPEKAADLLEEMAPDEAADVLGELPHEAQQELLVGECNLRDLLLADPAARLATIAREPPATVEPKARLRDVAAAVAKYNLVSLPVVDERGVLQGMVTVDDILARVIDA
ncbi:MAG TPA: CBS domain-containing protein, partial [Anaeromyxobacteraceae bacterium]|nr:CBS domain-containing protein [Anaeromyxobacteraceae bacterium]